MSYRQYISVLTLISFALILVSYAIAETPRFISYQGKATDAAGNPIANGTHDFQFRIYDKNNNLRWSEDASITTSEGLFSHNLGSVNPLDPTNFNWIDSMYLQITFDGEVQTPRTMFTASPYAFHVNSVDGSNGGIIDGYVFIHSDAADDEVAGIQATSEGNGNVWIRDIDGLNRIELNSEARSLDLYDLASTSAPARISSQGSSILINTDQTGNSSVYLPNNAISKNEIIDEPGVGSYINETGDTLHSQFVTTDLGSRVMFTPSDGYVLVITTAEASIYHLSGDNEIVSLGISDNCTSLYESTKINLQLASGIQSGNYSIPVTVHGLFPVDSGSTTFCFMAELISPSSITIENISMSLLFVPTAYTTVISPGAASAPGDPESERAAESSFHEARLQAELEQMKAEVEAMKLELNKVIEKKSN